jgi:hypothetical protein
MEKTQIFLLPQHSLEDVLSSISPMMQKEEKVQEKRQEQNINQSGNKTVSSFPVIHGSTREEINETHLELDPLKEISNFFEVKPIPIPIEVTDTGRDQNKELIEYIKDEDLAEVGQDITQTEKHFNNCSECTKSFNSKKNLDSHFFAAHKNPGNCNICGKFFSSLKQTKRHVKEVHYDGPSLKCHNCSQSFKTPSTLKNHLAACRKVKQKKAQSPRQPKCGYCLAVYTLNHDLTQHIEIKHPGLPPIPW